MSSRGYSESELENYIRQRLEDILTRWQKPKLGLSKLLEDIMSASEKRNHSDGRLGSRRVVTVKSDSECQSLWDSLTETERQSLGWYSDDEDEWYELCGALGFNKYPRNVSWEPDVKPNDAVNNPSHYQIAPGVEVLDVIEKLGLGFHLGNTVKYILRAGKKDESKYMEDLKKARFYLNRYIEQNEANQK